MTLKELHKKWCPDCDPKASKYSECQFYTDLLDFKIGAVKRTYHIVQAYPRYDRQHVVLKEGKMEIQGKRT